MIQASPKQQLPVRPAVKRNIAANQVNDIIPVSDNNITPWDLIGAVETNAHVLKNTDTVTLKQPASQTCTVLSLWCLDVEMEANRQVHIRTDSMPHRY